jgi:phospholipase/lecithinase/hemolysin
MISSVRGFVAALAVGMSAVVGTAHASYSSLVIFGDSISDTGNVLSLTSAFGPTPFPSFPGAEGRFSNGPVWTEVLANGLGLGTGAANSNLFLNPVTQVVTPIGVPGGGNFAFGGARTGMNGSAGPNTGLFAQLSAWNGSTFAGALERAADPNALYVVVAGANDLRDIRSDGTLTGAERDVAAQQVAQNVVFAVNLLAEAGAQHFLISTLPDLGKTPEAGLLALQAGSPAVIGASTAVTLSFNQALATQSAGLDSLYQNVYGRDLDIRTLDFYGLFENVYQDATQNGGGVYGITNVTTPCINAIATPNGPQFYLPFNTANNCDVAGFSDPLHPSAAAHALLGAAALQTLAAPVPEPESYALLMAGLFMVLGAARRVRQAH